LLLEMLGCTVEVAADGREGVTKGLAWHPDVALLDIGLPFLNGFQVARCLRAALGPRLLLIAQTGYGKPADRQRGAEAGFDAYLIKPLDPDELIHWLAQSSAGELPAPGLRGDISSPLPEDKGPN
jgi:CheY-like chemotaxis protein